MIASSTPEHKKVTFKDLYGVAALLTLFMAGFMAFRAYGLDDAPPAARLIAVAGVPSSWGIHKGVGDIICMEDVRHCLRLPKLWMEQELVEDGLRRRYPVLIRYDPKSLSAWGSRVYYSLYELKFDERVIIGYEEMKEDLRSSRHFAQWAAAVLTLVGIVLLVLAVRYSLVVPRMAS